MTANAMYLRLQRMQNKNNKQERAFNAKEAQKAREFEKMLSDTAHQREVADLKAAGLNPMLSVNDGANSYTAASASADTDSAANAVASAYGSNVSAAATRAAAAEQASATRAAAASNYAAAQYQADKAYKLGVYKAKMDYKTKMDQPTGGFGFSMFDKWLTKGVKLIGKGIKVNKNSKAKSMFDVLRSNTTRNKSISVSDVSKMSKKYKQGIDYWLKHNNLKVNNKNRALAYNYISNYGTKKASIYYNRFIWNK